MSGGSIRIFTGCGSSQRTSVTADLMLSSGCTPLDVATATIKDNQELALALEESQLENVVQLLVAITTSFRGSQDLSDVATSNDLGLVHSSSFSVNFDWNPRVGGKCLQFLQCAVWVDSECVCVCVCVCVCDVCDNISQMNRSRRMLTPWFVCSSVTRSAWAPPLLERPSAYTQYTKKP